MAVSKFVSSVPLGECSHDHRKLNVDDIAGTDSLLNQLGAPERGDAKGPKSSLRRDPLLCLKFTLAAPKDW